MTCYQQIENLFSELMCLQFHQKRLVMIKPVRNLLIYNLQLIAESNSFIGDAANLLI